MVAASRPHSDPPNRSSTLPLLETTTHAPVSGLIGSPFLDPGRATATTVSHHVPSVKLPGLLGLVRLRVYRGGFAHSARLRAFASGRIGLGLPIAFTSEAKPVGFLQPRQANPPTETERSSLLGEVARQSSFRSREASPPGTSAQVSGPGLRHVGQVGPSVFRYSLFVPVGHHRSPNFASGGASG